MVRSLILISATLELVATLANNTIMSGRSIWWFRHLEHQHENPSIISDSIGRARMMQQSCRWSQNKSHNRSWSHSRVGLGDLIIYILFIYDQNHPK